MEHSPTTFEILKDIILIIFVAIGSFVALAGLRAWEIKLKGKSEYELAKKILKSVYSIREAINIVRSPLITTGEMYSVLKENGETIKENEFDNWDIPLVYETIWNEISQSLSELRLAEIDSEVLWDKTISSSLDKLKDIVLDLRFNLQDFLKLKRQDYSERNQQLIQKCEEIVYKRGTKDKPDSFSQKINEAICEIENLLRKYLK